MNRLGLKAWLTTERDLDGQDAYKHTGDEHETRETTQNNR